MTPTSRTLAARRAAPDKAIVRTPPGSPLRRMPGAPVPALADTLCRFTLAAGAATPGGEISPRRRHRAFTLVEISTAEQPAPCGRLTRWLGQLLDREEISRFDSSSRESLACRFHARPPRDDPDHGGAGRRELQAQGGRSSWWETTVPSCDGSTKSCRGRRPSTSAACSSWTDERPRCCATSRPEAPRLLARPPTSGWFLASRRQKRMTSDRFALAGTALEGTDGEARRRG